MFVEFKHSLRNYAGQIAGWGFGLALLGVLLVSVYDSFADQMDMYEQLVESFPQEFMAFFGDLGGMATPEGFVAIEFFSYMPLILGIFAIQAGSGLLARDEEEGRLDLVMAHPVSRSGLFVGRFLAFLCALAGILFIAWLGIVGPMNWSSLSLGWGEVARPFLSLYAEMALFGALGVLLSMLLPSRRLASMAAGLLLVASFFLPGFATLNENLETVARFSPLEYYQTQEAFAGLNREWLFGLLAAAAVFALLSWWRFVRRDIRVGGEGGWRLGQMIPWSSRTE
ncbi:MAG: ABC transporter permease subunit [Anaerolineales bacterium]|nr:ABC transporter permease subunit [Anaerolineales bacterium]